MKIAHLVFKMEMGGIESMLVNIANVQLALGHVIHIIIINNGEDDGLMSRLNPGIKVQRIGRPVGSKSPWYPIKVSWALRRIDPDVVHVHSVDIYPHIALAGMADRMCLTFHDVKFVNDRMPRYITKFARLFTISKSSYESLKKQSGGLESTIVYNGVNTTSFKVKGQANIEQPFKIVQVARLLHNHKGQDLLLRAAGILVDNGYVDFTIDFIGEGESELFLKNLAKELKLDSIVTFKGLKQQDYLIEHLSEYDLFVLPSRYEGFGISLIEAMSSGVPVVASNCDGPREILGEGNYGYLFENENVQDLADKIEIFLRGENDKEMPRLALERVKSDFDVMATAKKYLEEYEKMLSNI